MDDRDIATGVVSVATPGVNLGDDAEAAVWARRVNEVAAELVSGRPDRFGFFATLTLPDVDGALEAADHALGTLGADGVILEANSVGPGSSAGWTKTTADRRSSSAISGSSAGSPR